MDQILAQLGQLLLAAVPTIVIFLILYFAYATLVHRPLQAALAERHRKTEGAIAKAQADIAAADARTADYEQRLREAKMQVFKTQDAHRAQIQAARDKAIAEARAKADAMVKEARAAMERDVATAKAQLQAQSETLAGEIVRSVLSSSAAGAR